MSQPDAMGLTPEAAAGYEDFFVPAIFHQWPPRLADLCEIQIGQNVLDVGCGTGVVTRELVKRTGPEGRVTGIDLSDSMLATARKHCPEADFQPADATDLPFPTGAFDAVLSAFMLMFVPEPQAAIAEMNRVLSQDGQAVVSVWRALPDNPIYAALADTVHRVAGAEAAQAIAMPFQLGSAKQLETLLEQAGIGNATLTSMNGTATFPSLDELVRIEVEAWLLASSLQAPAIAEITDRFKQTLPELAREAPVTFPMNAQVAAWRRGEV